MSVPLISTVIPAYNAEPHLAECLDSVLAQRGPFRQEVIVVDDASTDATPAVAESHQGVRLLRLATNRGPSAARNLGVAAAKGDLIAFLDADDLWPADRLAQGVEMLAQHPDLGLVFGDCRRFDEAGERGRSFFADAELDRSFWGDAPRIPDQDLKLFRLNYIPTGAVLLRRQHFTAVGGFDEGRRMVEDLDLWLRLAEQCAFGYVTEVWQRKRSHGGNVSNRREAMALANLDVLQSHWRAGRRGLRRRGLRMRPYLAYEYCLLGDMRERAGDRRAARRWYLRALLTRPSVRPIYYWLRAALPSMERTGSAGGPP
jgi:glycosyltransferase involved in cell wall biosynthesis